ncbi:hypothetical protein, partial [Mycobacterium avium]|uniref:hypothetical protein n=1 Tax=Mycobacterium avium TaxID=1764 RepID=UPI001F400B1E
PAHHQDPANPGTSLAGAGHGARSGAREVCAAAARAAGIRPAINWLEHSNPFSRLSFRSRR